MLEMRYTAGITADGEFANAAIPDGRLSTPAPTMFFTRLNMRLCIVAVPPLSGNSPPLSILATVDDFKVGGNASFLYFS